MKNILICISNYKKEEYLERAIRSCEAQLTYGTSIKIVVVNDGSCKFNKKQLKCEFPNIKVINYKKNQGVAYASNRALYSCDSDYFLRVDADDYIGMKSCLILSTFLIENPKIPFVYGDILLINKKHMVSKISRKNRSQLLEHGAGIMFRSSQLKSINGYNNKLKNCEDFDLIIRIEKKYGYGYHIPFSYYRYYKDSKNSLSKSKNRSKYLKIMKSKYEKYL